MTISQTVVNRAMFRSPANYLVYLIGEERLYGKVGGEQLSLRAYSGGARGSRVAARPENSAASFDVRKGVEGHGPGERGGPLPPGHYLAHATEQHHTLGRANWLESVTAHLKYQTRDYSRGPGFYIHGRGPLGSDGCIVPDAPAQREHLQSLIDSVGHPIPLWVVFSRQAPSQTDILKRLLDPYAA